MTSEEPLFRSINTDSRIENIESPPKRPFSCNFFKPYLTLFSGSKYRYLWFSSIVSLIGDTLNELACIIIISSITSSSFALSFFMICRELPHFLLGPVAGVVVDTFDRKKVMIFSDLIRFTLGLGYLLVRSESTLWLIFVLPFAQFSLSAFFNSAERSILPSLVGKELLAVANVFEALTWGSFYILGAGIGGFVSSLFGTAVCFILDAISFLFSALLLWKLPSQLPKVEEDEENLIEKKEESTSPKKLSPIKKYLKGMSYLWKNNYFLVISFVKSGGTLVWGALEIALMKFASSEYQIGDDPSLSLASLYASIGFGSGVAPFIVQRLVRDNDRNNEIMIVCGYFLLFTGAILMGLRLPFWVFILANIWRTLGSGFIWIYSSVILQRHVSNDYLGRVMSFEFANMMLFSIASRLLFGLLNDTLEWRLHTITFFLGGIGAVLFIFWSLYFPLYHCVAKKSRNIHYETVSSEDSLPYQTNIAVEEKKLDEPQN